MLGMKLATVQDDGARRTAAYRLIEALLGRPLAAYVRALRKTDHSWEAISRDIWSKTGVSVSAESVRQWFADEMRDIGAGR